VHSTAARLFANHFTRLRLGSDEDHIVSRFDDLFEEVLRAHQSPHRLAKIDDVVPVMLLMDVGGHGRMPTARPVAEVDSGFNQFLDL
jgi:hypothetical protein